VWVKSGLNTEGTEAFSLGLSFFSVALCDLIILRTVNKILNSSLNNSIAGFSFNMIPVLSCYISCFVRWDTLIRIFND